MPDLPDKAADGYWMAAAKMKMANIGPRISNGSTSDPLLGLGVLQLQDMLRAAPQRITCP